MAPLPDFSAWGEVERRPLSNVRRATAQDPGYASAHAQLARMAEQLGDHAEAEVAAAPCRSDPVRDR